MFSKYMIHRLKDICRVVVVCKRKQPKQQKECKNTGILVGSGLCRWAKHGWLHTHTVCCPDYLDLIYE